MDHLPPEPGTYLLALAAAGPVTVTVGRLGRLTSAATRFLYVGSAHGPGGLRARVARHLRGGGRRHWHIDYLRPHVTPYAVWYVVDPVRHEHAWAAALAALPGLAIPLPGFGSSDCRCSTHLFSGSAPLDRSAIWPHLPLGGPDAPLREILVSA